MITSRAPCNAGGSGGMEYPTFITTLSSSDLPPLAGILTGLEWLKESRPQAKWLATFATDTPRQAANAVSESENRVLESNRNASAA
jgi:molybdopterin-guanine dinucleotide biosynthesis protein A